ncbi:VOC family protein [Bacillus sp. NPDC077027]|uniref:VOC family protein n=1 Tax=Bacillus sp. NPDC077027 TaxID=3390548 RepID=UPI003D04E2B8
MGLQTKHVYINLPVKDVEASIAFFSQIGFEFHPSFTNDQAACLIINDATYAMLLSYKHFQSITQKNMADASQTTEVIVALQANSKEEVDEMVEHALAAGGSTFNERQDHGFMYGWSFQDIDGHLWEVFYMDEDHDIG